MGRPNSNRVSITLILSLVFLLLPSLVLADSNMCVTTGISRHTILRYNSTGAISEDIVYNETCAASCNNATGQCNTDPLSAGSTTMFYFLFPATAAVVLYMIFNLKEEDWPLHILGIGIALFLLLVPFGTLADILPNHFLRTFQLLAIGSIIIFIYYLLKLMAMGVAHAQKGGGA